MALFTGKEGAILAATHTNWGLLEKMNTLVSSYSDQSKLQQF